MTSRIVSRASARNPFAVAVGAGGLALCLALLPAGPSFAADKGKGHGGPGGASAGHMSDKGMSNTNSPASSDPDKGLERARERTSEQGLEHGKALQGQDMDQGKAKAKAKGKSKTLKGKGKAKGHGKTSGKPADGD